MQGSLPGLNGIRIWRQPISAQYRRAVPLTAAALRQLGQIALSQQDWQEAIDLFSQAVEKEEKPISGMLLWGWLCAAPEEKKKLVVCWTRCYRWTRSTTSPCESVDC